MYPSKVNDDLHRIFLIGQVFHELVQDTVFGDFQNEVEVKGSYGKINLIGHCDVLTDDAVVELKTCSYIPKEPYTHHILQVNAYAKLLGKDVVDIVYLQKNKLDVAVFRLQFDDELYNKLCETFHDAYDGIEQEILPYNVRSSECRFCNYRQLCMKGVR
jgi:CRISPR/Cas system-associated exonuclease Cas4 (RecB family)